MLPVMLRMTWLPWTSTVPRARLLNSRGSRRGEVGLAHRHLIGNCVVEEGGEVAALGQDDVRRADLLGRGGTIAGCGAARGTGRAGCAGDARAGIARSRYDGRPDEDEHPASVSQKAVRTALLTIRLLISLSHFRTGSVPRPLNCLRKASVLSQRFARNI